MPWKNVVNFLGRNSGIHVRKWCAINRFVVDRGRCRQRRLQADQRRWRHAAACNHDSVPLVCSWSHDMVCRPPTDNAEHILLLSPSHQRLNARCTTPPVDASVNDETDWRTPLYTHICVQTVYTYCTDRRTTENRQQQHYIHQDQKTVWVIAHFVPGIWGQVTLTIRDIQLLSTTRPPN